jgi:hypothetical protein
LVNNNKNITLRILGGVGNQLFLFSFLIYLEKKYKLKVHIDYKSGYQNFLGGNIFQQKFLLNKLNYNFFYQKDKYCFLGFFHHPQFYLLIWLIQLGSYLSQSFIIVTTFLPYLSLNIAAITFLMILLVNVILKNAFNKINSHLNPHKASLIN